MKVKRRLLLAVAAVALFTSSPGVATATPGEKASQGPPLASQEIAELAEANAAAGVYGESSELEVSEVVLTRDENGTPTSGMVSYPLEYKGNSALIQPLTNAPGVGGGTWNYGSRIDIRLGKVCYSEYHHPTLMHSASVEMDGMTNSVTEGPNRTAKASVRLPFSELEEGKYCNAFWSTSDW